METGTSFPILGRSTSPSRSHLSHSSQKCPPTLPSCGLCTTSLSTILFQLPFYNRETPLLIRSQPTCFHLALWLASFSWNCIRTGSSCPLRIWSLSFFGVIVPSLFIMHCGGLIALSWKCHTHKISEHHLISCQFPLDEVELIYKTYTFYITMCVCAYMLEHLCNLFLYRYTLYNFVFVYVCITHLCKYMHKDV